MPSPDIFTGVDDFTDVDDFAPPSVWRCVTTVLEDARSRTSDTLSSFPPSRFRAFLEPLLPNLALSSPEDTREQFGKLVAADVVIGPDGTIDLTAAGSNRFNITLFRMQNGTFRSGADLLEERKATSVFEFFQQRCSDPSLLRVPHRIPDLTKRQYVKYTGKAGRRDKKDGEFARDEVIAVARAIPNIKKMAQLFGLRIEEDHWTAFVTQRPFRTSWLMMNGGSPKGGPKVLEIIGAPNAQNREGIELFFRLVFGDSIRLVMSKTRGTLALEDHYTPAFIIGELQKPENLEIFFAHGVRLEDDKCHVTTSIASFNHDVKMRIDGKSVVVNKILKALGLGVNQRGLKSLLHLVFPNHRMLFWREKNGYCMERQPVETVLAHFIADGNVQILRAFVTTSTSLNPSRLRGCPFTLSDESLGIIGILNRFNLPHTSDGVRELCRMANEAKASKNSPKVSAV